MFRAGNSNHIGGLGELQHVTLGVPNRLWDMPKGGA
jgi:hypothetical protein